MVPGKLIDTTSRKKRGCENQRESYYGISTPDPTFLGSSVLRYVTKTRLLGMTVENRLTWVPHVLDLKKSFANKVELLTRSRFLPKDVLQKFYFSVILPSVMYGLVLWGACCNSDIISSVERLYCRAARRTWHPVMY